VIRADTPSGTEIICIDASAGPHGAGGLTLGALYTVERIETALYGRYVVLLHEVPVTLVYEPPWGLVTMGFDLKRFRYLDLPDALTALLNDATAALEAV
jgi:hypothetical protein